MPFPGATVERDEAAYVLTGAPLDATTTFQPGTRFGPERVRKFAATYDDYDRRTDSFFSDLRVHDAGDVPAWDALDAYLDHLTAELRAAVIDDAVPLLVGGEHTVTWAGVRATDPDVLVAVDAHLDLRDAYDGNPLNHACVVRRCLDGYDGDGADGDRVAEGDGYPTVDEVVILGARTGSPEEWERADASDATVVAPEDVADWTREFDGFGDRDAYLSIDIDGADPGFAPGTGTMEPFGLSPRAIRDAVRAVAPDCVGVDAVEVNDRDDGQAAALAGKLLREAVFSHADAD
ncbi:arginase family protein [Halobaculum sp. CBA1158]|uniref:arginase family protein n=1 Tax=Halobaculum sp. CBA1158 TaxID=2904243 RepID=UPI001F2F673F|nr:arginase family protein [Halobaculum sp. CBA1158]UIO99501.1 arginase family protein [Halobaculum sp. CBA1158]